MLPARASTARSMFVDVCSLSKSHAPMGRFANRRLTLEIHRSLVLTTYSNIRIFESMKIHGNDMLAAADEAIALLKALANRHRLLIVCQLTEKERSVGELAVLLKIRDSTVSQHLALLRKDGLVIARRDGQTIWYSIGSAPARELVRTLYRVYCAPASACRATPHSKTTPPARRRLAANQ